ncbi:AAA family ATPase, partial [Parabacteroides goldsteinii]
MSKYKYSLYGYHAIEKADITINGITVLSGENGCGKSTLSRWLYYIINESNKFDESLYEEFSNQLRGNLHKLFRASREISQSDEFTSYHEVIDQINDQVDIDTLKERYISLVKQFELRLISFLSAEMMKSRKKRIFSYLKISYNDDKILLEKNIAEFFSLLIADFDQKYEELYLNKEKRSLDQLYRFIKRNYLEEDKAPSKIQLSEDGVKLLEKGKFDAPLMIHRAIYIDTPMALSDKAKTLSTHWTDLYEMMISPRGEMPQSGKKVLLRIRRLINGQIIVEDDTFGFNKELHFHREDGLNIPLEKAATGLKAFAYLQRLLENGYLNEETLLLIDEPEAHLHPQWIVEFARLLVLLHKELGLKIMIASHNPDMVAAIQSIAHKEDI